jgi:hypothetical protein
VELVAWVELYFSFLVVVSQYFYYFYGFSAFSDGYMLGCGDWRDDEEACLNRLVSEISRLAEDATLRDALSGKCRSLVDGLGASRIAGSLLK